MAGSPLGRQRKLGVRLEDGRVIAFPRMPRVADLPTALDEAAFEGRDYARPIGCRSGKRGPRSTRGKSGLAGGGAKI
jgi:hypothetical protein